MLGFIGFTIAALIISLFAISFYKSFKTLNERRLQLFSGAFLSLGLALFTWGFAPLINTPSVTEALVFGGDVFLVAGTCFLIAAQSRVPKLWLTVTLVVFAAFILTGRAYFAPSDAHIDNGLLHFNLEGVARYVVVALLAFVWMPLGTRITQLAVRSQGVPQFGGAIALVYITSLVCAALFIGSRQDLAIIASFAALSFTFLILAFIPLLIAKYAKLVHTPSRQPQSIENAPRKKGVHHGK